MKHYFTNKLLNLNEEEMIEEEVPAEETGDEEVLVDEDGNPVEEEMVDEFGNPIDDGSIEPTSNSNSNSTDALRLKHLYSLATKLYEYGEFSENNLKRIDQSNIKTEVIVRLNQLRDRMDFFLSKCREYINIVFPNETFEKNLYIYLSLKNELLALTKFLRQLLNLQTMELDETDKKDASPFIKVN